jgi:hypothetical protein
VFDFVLEVYYALVDNYEIILKIAAIIGALTVIYKTVVSPIMRFGKKIDDIHEALPVLKGIAQEFKNNGGSSLLDRFERMELALVHLHECVESRDDIAKSQREDAIKEIENLQKSLSAEISATASKFETTNSNYSMLQLQMGTLIKHIELLLPTK